MTSNGWNFLCIFLQTLENPVGAVGENIHKEEKRDVKGGRIGPFDAQARMRERFLKFALNADEFGLRSVAGAAAMKARRVSVDEMVME